MATIDSMNKDTTRLSDGPDWTFDLLDVYLAEIDRVAKLYRSVFPSIAMTSLSSEVWQSRIQLIKHS